MNGADIRNTMLEVINELTGSAYLQSGSVLKEVKERLKINGSLKDEQAILTFWSDLFRQGHLAWGYNLQNIEPPFCHITELGRKTLENYSRDPANPQGYLSYLKSKVELEKITESYIKEGVQTYNAGCFKAAAVMVGGASESLVMQLRDAMVFKMNNSGKKVSDKIKGWQIKGVLDSIKSELDRVKRNMPKNLKEGYESYWPAFVQNIRSARNDAGHPSNIELITEVRVHSALLIFPELAELIEELLSWVKSEYQ